jgi:hypothetical protein
MEVACPFGAALRDGENFKFQEFKALLPSVWNLIFQRYLSDIQYTIIYEL